MRLWVFSAIGQSLIRFKRGSTGDGDQLYQGADPGPNAMLEGANLDGAYFPDADLQNAKLNGAHLAGTSLGEVDFTNADLSDADFTDSYLGNVKLVGANLTNANLNGVNRRDKDENCEKRDRQL